MVYYSNGQIVIRNMEDRDAQLITDAEIEQGWHATVDKYQKRLEDQRLGKAVSLVAEYSGKPVGYINIYPNAEEGPFEEKGYGSAQRMYVKRGYIPDGSGVWYQDKICAPHGDCKNDDDLVLYLSKKLSVS